MKKRYLIFKEKGMENTSKKMDRGVENERMNLKNRIFVTISVKLLGLKSSNMFRKSVLFLRSVISFLIVCYLRVCRYNSTKKQG